MLAAFTRTISRCWSRTMEAKRGETPTPWLTEAQPIPTETLPCAERRLVVLGTPAPTLSTPMRLTAAPTAPSCGKKWAGSSDNREMREWWIVRYGQDGNYPAGAGVADGCDPTVYTCFFNGEAEGSLARVP